jgi:hypothetical protein
MDSSECLPKVFDFAAIIITFSCLAHRNGVQRKSSGGANKRKQVTTTTRKPDSKKSGKTTTPAPPTTPVCCIMCELASFNVITSIHLQLDIWQRLQVRRGGLLPTPERLRQVLLVFGSAWSGNRGASLLMPFGSAVQQAGRLVRLCAQRSLHDQEDCNDN